MSSCPGQSWRSLAVTAGLALVAAHPMPPPIPAHRHIVAHLPTLLQVKGSNVCELCKAEIRNIPAPPPRPTEADLPQLDEAYFAGGCLLIDGWLGWWVVGGVLGHTMAWLLLMATEPASRAFAARLPAFRAPALLATGLRLPRLPRSHHPLPSFAADPSHIHDFMPSSQDLVFDCIRVTWVAMVSGRLADLGCLVGWRRQRKGMEQARLAVLPGMLTHR